MRAMAEQVTGPIIEEFWQSVITSDDESEGPSGPSPEHTRAAARGSFNEFLHPTRRGDDRLKVHALPSVV